MIAIRSLMLLCLMGIIATKAFCADPLPRGIPEQLQGMPPAVIAASREIQQTLVDQSELIKKASQAKTPAEREEVFQAVITNVQEIAQKRVVVLEHYTDRARARVEWARKHATEVSVSDLAEAMKDLSHQEYRPRLPEESNSPISQNQSSRAKLPKQVLESQMKLRQTLGRLQSLVQLCESANDDEQLRKIKEEIDDLLQVVEKQRIVILETVLRVSEQRLEQAKKRAKEACPPSSVAE